MDRLPTHLPPILPTQVLYDLLLAWKEGMGRLRTQIDELPHNHVHRRLLETMLRSRRECAGELSRAVNDAFAVEDAPSGSSPASLSTMGQDPGHPPSRPQLLVELHRSCSRRCPELRAIFERLWLVHETLQSLLLTGGRNCAALDIPPILRETVTALESLSPLAPPEPEGRVLAAEFYRLLDPGCQADQGEPMTDEGYTPALVAMLTACQTLYFVFGQLQTSVDCGVGFLSGPKREVLRLQFRLE